MVKTIVEQYEKRKNELPVGTRQNIVIDARGQGITAVQEKEIIQKIIDKSNGTIKKSDITIWK
jgi:hemolysin